MDELESLRTLGGDPPRPNAVRLREIRAPLSAAIEAEVKRNAGGSVSGQPWRWALVGAASLVAAIAIVLTKTLPFDHGDARSAAA